MEFAHLQAFIAVAEQRSFSRAAGQLFLTQPAISKRIGGLEEELGSPLFDRIGHQVQLTEAGRALLPRARQLLLDREDSRRAIRNLSGQIAGQLSMGTSHHIGLHRLPAVLRRYTTAYPAVELDLQFMESEQVCHGVLHGDCELGVVTLPLVPPAELRFQPIWRDPLAIVIGTDHPLARASSATPETLLGYPAILPMRGTYTRELVEQAFAQACPDGLLRVKLATNNLETIKMMVSIGLGWSVLPQTLVDDELQTLQWSPLQLERQLGVVWHAGRTLSNAATAMLDSLQHNADPG
ncbi:LysR family transcriptional regulator [Thiohalophilus thiocyanatoxydans]|uniref:LysR family transcriptional regulator n=1 Tax=Thiohalophilus thiocyanatoxydans TaxID=381308 RepID=A0A4R8IJ19_9GAMM|nr:LysR family transcriptional regulator [Thiohalophilus thiocyanatoxydans]TDY00024.1 LysR family transcriptional regulator [Thiohalophilus thiocyanatoxydans]